jgi:hypothetical protein
LLDVELHQQPRRMTLEEPKEPQGEKSNRRAYEKPAIAWEETLEIRKTLAVACAKVAGRSAICTQFPTS